MSRKRKADKMYYKRSRSSLAPIFTFLLVCGGISFAVASVWHNVSGDAAVMKSKKAAQQTQTETETPIGQTLEPEKIEESTEQILDSKETQKSTDQTENIEIVEQVEPSSDKKKKSDNNSNQSSVASSPALVGESERVKSEYFDDAAFVGDSITQGIQVYDIMSGTTVIANTGLNPQSILNQPKIRTADGYVTALEALKQDNPKKIYIMLGVNGIGFDLETFTNLYKEFVSAVKEQHPESTIYIQSMLPVTKAFEEGTNNPYDITNQKINTYNESIIKIAENLDVYYLDVASAIKDADGYLPNEASPTDGIHFGPTYYSKWFDYLKTHTA